MTRMLHPDNKAHRHFCPVCEEAWWHDTPEDTCEEVWAWECPIDIGLDKVSVVV